MVDRPLISCIVPVYNGERYLAKALDSIIAQSYRPLEILVVDDGSTDRTPAVIASYGSAVRVLQQANLGHAAARNRGIAAASGAFLSFLDADDRWHPAKLERQMARFEHRPELEASVTQVQNFWIPELQAEAERYRHRRYGQPLPGYALGTLLAHRALFKRIGQTDTSLHHGDDFEWFLRAQQHGATIELLPEVLVYRRLHRSNRSRLHAEESRAEYVDLLKAHLDRQRGRPSTAP